MGKQVWVTSSCCGYLLASSYSFNWPECDCEPDRELGTGVSRGQTGLGPSLEELALREADGLDRKVAVAGLVLHACKSEGMWALRVL